MCFFYFLLLKRKDHSKQSLAPELLRFLKGMEAVVFAWIQIIEGAQRLVKKVFLFSSSEFKMDSKEAIA